MYVQMLPEAGAVPVQSSIEVQGPILWFWENFINLEMIPVSTQNLGKELPGT